MFAHDAPSMTDAPPGDGLALLAAAELQDHLMVAGNDLERLQRLLSDACDSLMHHFCGASGELRNLQQGVQAGLAGDELKTALQHMAGAITAMQFQDMASQLVDHTGRRLRNCVDRLARDAFADDEDGEAVVEAAPLRPNPVTQDEMDAGSIELF
jgi:hypothetical protein